MLTNVLTNGQKTHIAADVHNAPTTITPAPIAKASEHAAHKAGPKAKRPTALDLARDEAIEIEKKLRKARATRDVLQLMAKVGDKAFQEALQEAHDLRQEADQKAWDDLTVKFNDA